MQTKAIPLALSAMALTLTGCLGNFAPLPVVEDVDLERYAGLWYEIARYPNSFQGQCVGGTTAEYTLLGDNRVEVVNRCLTSLPDGPVDTIVGTGRIPNPDEPAKLKVSFFAFFEGDYWIIELDEDYQWAVVSEPGRRLLWILSRTPSLDDATYQMILDRLEAKDFDLSQLELTPQPAAE
jgi:apolipoprotein D and lipocalin family protein